MGLHAGGELLQGSIKDMADLGGPEGTGHRPTGTRQLVHGGFLAMKEREVERRWSCGRVLVTPVVIGSWVTSSWFCGTSWRCTRVA